VGAGPRSGRSGSGRGSGARHPPSISTLGAGTGEVRGGRTERRGGRGKMLVVAALVAGGGIAAAAFKLTSTPSPPLVSAPAPPGPAARPVEPPPAPAVAADPPKRAKPQTVSVRINSEPSDASLIDARTGDTLGRTPFLRDLPRADATMMVTVRKGGYRSKQISLDLDRDTALEVKLEHKPASSSSSKPSEDDVYRKL
jgi:hypothetical protein